MAMYLVTGPESQEADVESMVSAHLGEPIGNLQQQVTERGFALVQLNAQSVAQLEASHPDATLINLDENGDVERYEH